MYRDFCLNQNDLYICSRYQRDRTESNVPFSHPSQLWETYGRADIIVVDSLIAKRVKRERSGRLHHTNRAPHQIMCKQCAQIIRDMDVRETDLPLLPHKSVKWHCIVPGCKGCVTVRDYGITPYYYWPVKIRYTNEGYRGGWIDSTTHYYFCSKHWKPITKGEIIVPEYTPKLCASRFVTLK